MGVARRFLEQVRNPAGNDNYENSTWVLCFLESSTRIRYDYVVMVGFDPTAPEPHCPDNSCASLTPSGFKANPITWKLNEAAQMLKASHFSYPEKGGDYMYVAFVESWNNSETSGYRNKSLPQHKQVRDCLLDGKSTINIIERGVRGPGKYRCSDYIDMEQWNNWNVEYEVQKAMHMVPLPLGISSVDYETYQAIWTGLVGAVLNSIFVTFGLILYFGFAVFQALRDWKEEHRGENVDEEDDHDDGHDPEAQDAILPPRAAAMSHGNSGQPQDPSTFLSTALAGHQSKVVVVSCSVDENSTLGRNSATDASNAGPSKPWTDLSVLKKGMLFASPRLRRASSLQILGFRDSRLDH